MSNLTKPERTWWHEKKCAKCGKVFLAAPQHIYRKQSKSNTTWTCFNHKDDKKKG